ncbi:MAG: AarF/ABC1/UbiB kinase family protein [Oligoflexia bacterium]|nr:AarF/ABC1/UbiB kinase family protein [Oligoflexia bacterium]
MRIVRPLVQTVGDLGHRVRDLNRLQEVARILVRNGLGMLVAGVDIPGFTGWNDKSSVPRIFQSTPDRVVHAIDQLGPTYVKLGQVLSTRPDLLPADYITALESLQDDIAPLPFSDIQAQLEDQLGAAWREHLAVLDETPLATASIAQVHRASLYDGRQVVLKVQRPGIGKKIEADLHILVFLARRALIEYPEVKAFDPLGVLDEFERSIEAELDFEEEARHMERFRRMFADKTNIVRVPYVVDELSTQRVLCMEYLPGTKMRRAREAGHDMQVVGERYLEVAYDMLFEYGYFHGDLHPGNVVVMEDNVLGLLDFGMVGHLTEDMRANVIQTIYALLRGDYRTVARVFYEVAIKDERVDYRTLERHTIDLMDKYWSGESIKEMRIGPYVLELATRSARVGARVPTSYTMFFKAIVTSEGLAKTLIEEVDPLQAAEPYIRRFMARQLSAERVKDDLIYTGFALSSLSRRLPGSLAQFMDDVEAQRLLLNVADPDAELNRASADRRVNRGLATALSIAAFFCGTLSLFASPFHPWGVPIITIVFYLAGIAIGAVALLMVARNRGPM